MSKKIPYMITDQNITVNFDGQTHIVPRADALADRLIKAIKEKNFDEIPNLVSAAKRIENFGKGNFVVKDGLIFVNGVEAPPVLGNKIIKFSNEGLPYEPLVEFAARLQQNPSYRAVQELFTFLEKNDHPITENGNFIAYKRVRGTFKDIHSNTMDNSPGQVVQMPRNQVNEDATQTCSYGLHVANWDYAHTKFASDNPDTDVMLEVEVDPADVVAIPVDYNNAKMRVCKYTVLGVVDSEHSSDVQLRVVNPVVDSEFDDDDLDDDRDYDSADEDVHDCYDCGGPCEEGDDICVDCDVDNDVDEDKYPYEDELE